MLSFDPNVIKQLQQAIQKPQITALCGPAGSGKRTLLEQLVPHVAVYDLDYCITKEEQLRKIANMYMGNVPLGYEGVKAVGALKPAELVDIDLSKFKVKFPLILLSNQKVHGVPIIYMKPMQLNSVISWVQNRWFNYATAVRVAKSAGTDLRQFKIRTWDEKTAETDKDCHISFDT